ncbi:MAG: hypothetical protein Kow0075_11840 [Salibacteraceae bacterium]
MGNGLADIRLEFNDNHRFVLFLSPLDNSEAVKLKGRWRDEGNFRELKFKKRSIDLRSLFPDTEGSGDSMMIIDKRRVRFPVASQGVYIWGILCLPFSSMALGL